MANLTATDHHWVANRQIWQVIQTDLYELRPAFDALLPREPALSDALRDLIELASAGLLDGVAWTFSAPRAGPGTAFHLLMGARYHIIVPPPPFPLAPAPIRRPVFQEATFQLHFRPTQRFRNLSRQERTHWLQTTALPWDPLTTQLTPARPFRPTRYWPLATRGYLVKETSHVGDI